MASPSDPTLQVYRGDMLLIEIGFAAEEPDCDPLVISEADRVSFELSPMEPGREYEVYIGDFPIPNRFSQRGKTQWPDDAYFDSARGRTSLSVRSREIDGPNGEWTPRGKFDLWVCPSKLTEDAYRKMFDDLARLSAGLVFDLLSKSVAGLGKLRPASAGTVAIRSAQIELHI